MNRISKTNAEIKALARVSMLGKYPGLIGCLLVFYLINALPSQFLTILTSNNSKGPFTLNILIAYIISVIIMKIQAGLMKYYMKLCKSGIKSEPPKISDLFSIVFSFNANETLALAIYTFFTYLCFIPLLVCFEMVSFNSLQNILVTLAFLLAGITAYILLDLNFFPLLYLVNDLPDASFLQILFLAPWLMKENKTQLFLMKISFIALYIPAILSLGLGLFILKPYIFSTYAHFYFELCEAKEKGQD